jgi:DNA-binding CsgD family transcriptional regulator
MHLVSVTPAQSANSRYVLGAAQAGDTHATGPDFISGDLRDKLQRTLASVLGCAVVVTNSVHPEGGGEVAGSVSSFWIECYADGHNGELRRGVMGLLPSGRGPGELLALGLSARESEVLYWVAQGKTNPEIAVILGIGRRTVATHVEHILAKLGVENRCAAARCASEVLFG